MYKELLYNVAISKSRNPKTGRTKRLSSRGVERHTMGAYEVR